MLATRATPIASVLLAVALLAGCSGEEAQRAPEAPAEASAASPAGSTDGASASTGETVPMPPTTEERSCPPEREEWRIGDFAPPEEPVPPYEVLEEENVRQDCAEAIRLLVDTRASDEAGYALIARDLKALHRDLDAVSVEFTDTEGTFSYSGAALIFNTSAGAEFIGYTYGAPNDEGYYVSVADE
ncbi:hypothetical protein GBA65_00705 [Rubrobacter marinus]|uniref:Lipoprotein n=1 Tax=Rubrobacter marinus TaxID=2653852 RepID=A0A6G8PSC5_9ACTN|nr:hypothetical protein [Rubrobacter marinus]QIN77274.1 hypothetical protein GBA65_00705 [Rubrobacter marinus]